MTKGVWLNKSLITFRDNFKYIWVGSGIYNTERCREPGGCLVINCCDIVDKLGIKYNIISSVISVD